MHLLVHSIASLIDYAIVVLIGAPHLQMYGMLEVIPQVLQPEVLIDIARGVNTRCLPACLGSAHAGTGGGHHINDIIRATTSIGSATFCATRRRVVSESLTIRIGHRVCVRIQISADLFNACRLVEIASNQQICIGAGAGRGAAAGTVALIVASSTYSAVPSSFVLLREREESVSQSALATSGQPRLTCAMTNDMIISSMGSQLLFALGAPILWLQVAVVAAADAAALSLLSSSASAPFCHCPTAPSAASEVDLNTRPAAA